MISLNEVKLPSRLAIWLNRELFQKVMPYEWVGFRVEPPIREMIGTTPEDIKLITENGIITEIHVSIGEKQTEEIKNSEHFKEDLAKSRHD
jgi:hypothetical protein